MKYTILTFAILSLVGCSSIAEKVDANYAAFLQVQKEIATKEVKPIWEMEGIEGKEISLSGVKSIRVYAGSSTTAAPVSVMPYVKQKSDFAEGLDSVANIAGKLLNNPAVTILAGGHAAKTLADSVGASANHGYQWVQAPAPNQTINGPGVIGSGTLNWNELSGTGSLGSGSYRADVLSGTGALNGNYDYRSAVLSGSGAIEGTYSPDNSNQGNPVNNTTN